MAGSEELCTAEGRRTVGPVGWGRGALREEALEDTPERLRKVRQVGAEEDKVGAVGEMLLDAGDVVMHHEGAMSQRRVHAFAPEPW